MRIVPKTLDDWIGLTILPFKTFVILGFMLFVLLLIFDRSLLFPRHGVGAYMGYALGFGYLICVPCLLLGALIQSLFCERGAATSTLVFFTLAFLFLLMLK